MTPHGKRSIYVRGCRCDLCTKANRDYHTEVVAALRNCEPPADAHGKRSTYSNWGCRCAPCTRANSDTCRAYQQRRKATR